MGENTLTQIGNVTPVEATGDLVDQYFQALNSDFIPRSSDGEAEDQAGSLGTNNYQWDRIYVKNGLVLNGAEVDLGSIDVKQYAINSGKSNLSGYPAFLTTLGTSTSALLDTSAGVSPLELVINNNSLEIDSDQYYTSLSLGPSSNNICLVNSNSSTSGDYFAGADFTKYIGEYPNYGAYIPIDTLGTELSSLPVSVKAFKAYNGSNTEYFLGEIDVSNSRLYPFKRGIAGSNRVALTNNNTITLLKASYLFMELSGPTKHATTTFPSFLDDAPSSPSAGDWYFDTSTNVWNRYNGASWDAKNAIWIGTAISDSTGVIGVEPNDFDLAFRADLDYRMSYIDGGTVLVNINRACVGSQEIKTTSQRGRRIKLSEAVDRDTGVSETASTFYYVYLNSDAKPVFSDIGPRILDRRRGLYHPNKYYRFLGRIYNDSDSNIVKFEDVFSEDQAFRQITDNYTIHMESGDWDMQVHSSLTIPHKLGGLAKNITFITANVRNDINDKFRNLSPARTETTPDLMGYVDYWDTTNIVLGRSNAGVFNTGSYNTETEFNRCVLTINLSQRPYFAG